MVMNYLQNKKITAAKTALWLSLALFAIAQASVAQDLPRGTSSMGMASWSVPSGDLWWTWEGANLGAEGFGGAITGDAKTSNWFYTTLPPEHIHSVEIRFANVQEAPGENQYKPIDLGSDNVSWAYRYLRHPGAPAPAVDKMTTAEVPYDWGSYIVHTEGPGGWVYQDRRPIALSAWDISSDPPRRLVVAFLENNIAQGLVNGAYGPAWHKKVNNICQNCPMEWLFVFDMDYTDPGQGETYPILTRNGLWADAGETLPFMWIVYAARKELDRFPRDGDSFLLISQTPQPHIDTATMATAIDPTSWGAVKHPAADLLHWANQGK